MIIGVDEEKCKLCKKCISECPTKSLVLIDGVVSQMVPDLCLACGHCAAVCKESALSWNNKFSDRTFELTDCKSDKSAIDYIFQKTRSVRKFKKEILDNDTIVKLISYAEMAPSGDNFRNREYVVINDRRSISEMEVLLSAHYRKLVRFIPSFVVRAISFYSKTLAEEVAFVTKCIKSINNRNLEKENTIFRDAPCVIFVTGPKKSMLSKDDCVAAQNYMRIAGTTLGIGSCIIGFAQESKGLLEKYLKLDKNRKIYAATVFGFQSNTFLKDIEYPEPSIHWK